MQKDKLMEILIEEYSDQVKDYIVACYSHSKGPLDVQSLNSKIDNLRIQGAPTSSLSEDEWYEIIYELAPDVYNDLYYGSYAA